MAQRKGVEQGIREPVPMRVGIDLAYWQGLSLDKDGGAIGDSELREAINVRLNAGRIDARGGQSKLNDNALDGCVWSIDDLPLPVTGLFLTVVGTASSSGLDRYNLDTSPNYQVALPDVSNGGIFPIQHGRGSIFVWRGHLLIYSSDASGTGLYEVVLPKNSTDGQISVRQFLQLGTTAPLSFASVNEGDDDILYIGAASGAVYRYDGTLFSADGAVGTGSQIVDRYHDRLVSVGSSTLIWRLTGQTPTYTTYALPTTFGPSTITEWLQNAFIVGAAPGPLGTILMFDGSSVTTAHQPSATFNARNVSDGTVWNGKFWYIWRELGGTPHSWIGNYDGATWNDVVADLGGTQSGSSFTGYFAIANGLLYVTTIRDEISSGSNSHVLLSTPDGTNWSLVENISQFHTPGATGGNNPAVPVVFG